MKCCDIGAGAAHSTYLVAEFGLDVTALEPNDARRENGINKIKRFSNVKWVAGTGETTGQITNEFDVVTFGSSFNVCDSPATLIEVLRILKTKGWFMCFWKRRNLRDPIQAEIESIIKKAVPEYGYGRRREDHTAIIRDSDLFLNIKEFDGGIEHTQTIGKCVEAWRSHATISRQAGPAFPSIIENINAFLSTLEQLSIETPYPTVGWVAQQKAI
jgi:ubiquinone/menaquinone biosynthesis C-methylase UbiE